jgi:nucleoside-diphosphate-sugar epimerase
MHPKPPFPDQRQPMPGSTSAMEPRPDHGETTYKGSGRLNGKKAVITGGDSGIGRAVAIAFAREGADVAIAYLNEHDDANEVKGLIEKEGRKAILLAGDLRNPDHCRDVIQHAADALGGIDILVNNAAHQATFKDIGEISDEEWETTLYGVANVGTFLLRFLFFHYVLFAASVVQDPPGAAEEALASTDPGPEPFARAAESESDDDPADFA